MPLLPHVVVQLPMQIVYENGISNALVVKNENYSLQEILARIVSKVVWLLHWSIETHNRENSNVILPCKKAYNPMWLGYIVHFNDSIDEVNRIVFNVILYSFYSPLGAIQNLCFINLMHLMFMVFVSFKLPCLCRS